MGGSPEWLIIKQRPTTYIDYQSWAIYLTTISILTFNQLFRNHQNRYWGQGAALLQIRMFRNIRDECLIRMFGNIWGESIFWKSRTVTPLARFPIWDFWGTSPPQCFMCPYCHMRVLLCVLFCVYYCVCYCSVRVSFCARMCSVCLLFCARMCSVCLLFCARNVLCA